MKMGTIASPWGYDAALNLAMRRERVLQVRRWLYEAEQKLTMRRRGRSSRSNTACDEQLHRGGGRLLHAWPVRIHKS